MSAAISTSNVPRGPETNVPYTDHDTGLGEFVKHHRRRAVTYLEDPAKAMNSYCLSRREYYLGLLPKRRIRESNPRQAQKRVDAEKVTQGHASGKSQGSTRSSG